MSNFLEEFIERGYLYQATNLEKLAQVFSTQKIAAYIGFDCTAKSLHVGNLMQIMILRLLQQHGHKPIIIIGDATTTIGDPTGKTEMRKILSQEEIESNICGIQNSIAKFIKFGDGPSDALILRNSTWLNQLGYMDFLRNYGRYISVNKMVSMESAKLRLANNQHLSFLEFNYMLIQGYDFFHLNKYHNCLLQFGGSDQWGNIVTGIEIADKIGGQELFGITTPLLTTANGSKMGKSVNGAVWLNEDMLLPYDYYQFWRNIDDRDVIKFAKLYAEFNQLELDGFLTIVDSNINDAKKVLAFRLTQLCHGREQAEKAKDGADALFGSNTLNENIPSIEIVRSYFEIGIPINQLLVLCNLAPSNSEGKRMVRANSVNVNDVKISQENQIISLEHIVNNVIKLSSSSKKHIIIKPK